MTEDRFDENRERVAIKIVRSDPTQKRVFLVRSVMSELMDGSHWAFRDGTSIMFYNGTIWTRSYSQWMRYATERYNRFLDRAPDDVRRILPAALQLPQIFVKPKGNCPGIRTRVTNPLLKKFGHFNVEGKMTFHVSPNDYYTHQISKAQQNLVPFLQICPVPYGLSVEKYTENLGIFRSLVDRGLVNQSNAFMFWCVLFFQYNGPCRAYMTLRIKLSGLVGENRHVTISDVKLFQIQRVLGILTASIYKNSSGPAPPIGLLTMNEGVDGHGSIEIQSLGKVN